MSYLFYNCTSLKLLNLTTFDTGNVKYMKSMFERCTSLTSIILGNNFVSTKVENMDSMFHNCHFLESIDYPISIGDKVYNLTNFFSNCYSLTSINFQNFNTSKISYYTNMFYNCYKIKNIDVSKFLFKSHSETKFMYKGNMGAYWTRTLASTPSYARRLNFDISDFEINNPGRCYGQPVRAVKE